MTSRCASAAARERRSARLTEGVVVGDAHVAHVGGRGDPEACDDLRELPRVAHAHSALVISARLRVVFEPDRRAE